MPEKYTRNNATRLLRGISDNSPAKKHKYKENTKKAFENGWKRRMKLKKQQRQKRRRKR